jgi:dihydrolipoamide dehydrogenase
MEVKVPDIGDFDDVPVIEVLVSVGDEVAEEDPLITLESDKATMEVPAPAAGKVSELKVGVGDKVSEGTVILVLDAVDGDKPAAEAPAPAQEEPAAPKAEGDVNVQVAVLGAGPGGYTAAFRAADLGLSVALIDKGDVLGGVCLNVGCIPSKALLHVARVLTEAEEVAESGISFGKPEVDLDKVRAWKEGVVGKLTGGLESLAKQRKVQVVRGTGEFTGPNTIAVDRSPGGLASTGSNRPEGDSPAPAGSDVTVVAFEHCIIAAGSEPVGLPDLPDDERIMDSTGALEIRDVPERLLVIGGGIIGLEMATVYHALGSKVTVVELLDQLIPGADKDLVKVLQKRIAGRYENIHLGTKVERVSASEDGITVSYGEHEETFDRVLVCVGRRPNGSRIGAEKAGVNVTDRGFIEVDGQLRTNVSHIYAIGDVIGQPMLAHKATHEGALAAEVIHGEDLTWDVRSIPSVAYTDPEVAWTGLTETQAKEQGIEFEISTFPWAASGRALSIGRSEGITKVIVEPGTRRILGAGERGAELGLPRVHVVLDGDAEVDLGDLQALLGLELGDRKARLGERGAVRLGVAGDRAVIEPAVALGAERVEGGQRRHRLLGLVQEHRQVRAGARVHDLADQPHAGISRCTRVPVPGADWTVQSPP